MPGRQAPIRPAGRTPGRIPIWLQWVLSLSLAALLITALVVFVRHEDATANEPAPVTKPAAIEEQNREARILVRQDQAPHLVTLRSGTAAIAGLRSAVAAYMAHQISLGEIDGPLMHASCGAAAGSTRAREVFRCTVIAANVNYPFDGVVVAADRQIVYCKRDLPPVPSMNVPVTARCT